MSVDLQLLVSVVNGEEANFRRSVKNIVNEKFNGDIFAYIKNLVDTIDILEANLNNVHSAMVEMIDETLCQAA